MGSLSGDRLTQAGIKESPDDKLIINSLARIDESIDFMVA